MRVALPDGESARRFVVFTRQKTVDDARSYFVCAQHHGHRSSEVFTVTLLYIKEKIGERIGATGLQLERVAVVITQIRFECVYRVVPVCGATLAKHVAREVVDARIEIGRELHIPR